MAVWLSIGIPLLYSRRHSVWTTEYCFTVVFFKYRQNYPSCGAISQSWCETKETAATWEHVFWQEWRRTGLCECKWAALIAPYTTNKSCKHVWTGVLISNLYRYRLVSKAEVLVSHREWKCGVDTAVIRGQNSSLRAAGDVCWSLSSAETIQTDNRLTAASELIPYLKTQGRSQSGDLEGRSGVYSLISVQPSCLPRRSVYTDRLSLALMFVQWKR